MERGIAFEAISKLQKSPFYVTCTRRKNVLNQKDLFPTSSVKSVHNSLPKTKGNKILS